MRRNVANPREFITNPREYLVLRVPSRSCLPMAGTGSTSSTSYKVHKLVVKRLIRAGVHKLVFVFGD